MKEVSLKEIAIKDIGIELANNTGVAGRYLYHQGHYLEDIARAYKVSKSEMLLKTLTVLQEVKRTEWVEKTMEKAFK